MKITRAIGLLIFACLPIHTMADDSLALVCSTGGTFLPETPTSVLFFNLKMPNSPLGFLTTIANPGVCVGPDKNYWVAYRREQTTDIVKCESKHFTVVDRCEFPRPLAGTDLMFAPVAGVNQIVASSNDIVWIQTAPPESAKGGGFHIEAIDWRTKTELLDIAPPDGILITPRMYALGGGCLVTYMGNPKAFLYFSDGRKVIGNLMTESNEPPSTFEVGCSQGNVAWGLGRNGRLTRVEYSNEKPDLQVTSIKVDSWLEDKFITPTGITFDNEDRLLVVMTGDGNNKTELVRLVDPKTGAVINKFTLPGPASAVVYRQHKLYVVPCGEARITVYDESLKIIQQGLSFCPVLGSASAVN